ETPPIAPQMWQAYHIAGEVTAIAILAALWHRLDTGQGQQLATAVHDAVAKNTETDFPDWIYRRTPHNRPPRRPPLPISTDGKKIAPTTPRIAMTKDGRWVHPYMTYLPGTGSPLSGIGRLLTEHGLGDELSDDEQTGARQLNPLISRLVNGYTFDR